MQRLDRHRLPVGEPQSLDHEDFLGRRDAAGNRPRRAPASSLVERERAAPGTIPRRRMSSLNEVIVSSWAIFGCWTYVPLPRLRTR